MAKPYFERSDVRLYLGDCVELLRELPEASVDACVTDPPYGLEFMGKEWDRLDGPHWEAMEIGKNGRTDGRNVPMFQLQSPRYDPSKQGGRSMQAWHEAWAREVLRVLKPGGHLLAFGGTRTFHRLACAVEDAGFEVRDTLCWLFGQGFPKSHNLGDGRGTALKPAWESITLARKPLAAGTVAANVLEYGCGALNVDGCRIASNGDHKRGFVGPAPGRVVFGDRPRLKEGFQATDAEGRWPANVCLDETAAAALDAQAGERRSGTYSANASGGHLFGQRCMSDVYGDTGGASRFYYTAKASRSSRGAGNTHPTVKPVDLIRWLCRLVTPPGGTVLDPFLGSGTTALAARAEGFRLIGIEREEEYLAIAARRLSQEVLDFAE